MKRILSLIITLCLLLSTLTACKDKDGKDNQTGAGTDDSKVGAGACSYATSRDIEDRNLRFVKMTVKNHGSIVLLLDATTAPITVENFMMLVNKGFYNGLTFHRILDNFMIQGGDPKANGTGGNTDEKGNEINITGEFSANGISNDIKHLRGVISMARSNAMNSASSQFFICNADAPHLDGSYASFGYVLAGLDVVDSITKEGIKYTSTAENGAISDKKNQPVITSIVEMTRAEAEEYIPTPEPKPEHCSYFTTRSTEGRDIKYVKMTVQDHGDIILLLDATTAPITVANFLDLVNKNFYNGLTFHRIMNDFMIQGGDPNANGTGGNTDENGDKITITGEFSQNGINNDIKHYRGVISMARGTDKDSASSQFFICNADYTYLDGSYAAFGYVISGLSVVDSITKAGVKHAGYNGTISDKTKQPVITSIVEITKDMALSYVQ